MEDSYGGGKKAVESEDLQEEEVWEMINAREGSNSNSSSKTRSNSYERGLSSSSSAWGVNATPRATGGRAARHQSSASVDIPDSCSKIVKKRSKNIVCGDDDDEKEEEGGMAPPHEYLDRRLERIRIASSHSMCEGIGRTLKGRDLSKMRNAILTKTGFIE